ncbi:MAG: multicopper oxidase domain-containing protein [Caldilineaceae bacterium]|nr:multicopper oxidase domain-containing protein [Caldilineaceae bacterium]
MLTNVKDFFARPIYWAAFFLLLLPFLSSCAPLVDSAAAAGGRVRTYYIAADEVAWNYAPSYPDLPMMEMPLAAMPHHEDHEEHEEHEGGVAYEAHDADVFLANGPDRIGAVYIKALYREYTDDTFTTLKEREPAWEHLGVLGPVLHAEVGDTIEVVFKNNASFPFSVHPHGVFYEKDSEGAPYGDGTSDADKADDAVPPGGTHTYIWEVPERAGPGPNDPSSIAWLYHSHTHEVSDTYSGLIGPIIITAKGHANPDGSPNDVDREFVTLFHVYDENASLYLEQNIETYVQKPHRPHFDDEEFAESNLMHAMNGYVFGNLPGLTMAKGEQARWYVMAMGTEVDIHTPHWHGNTGLINGHRTDVLEVFPASMKVFDMVADNPGTWMYHCHVNDHIAAGMMAVYTVTE